MIAGMHANPVVFNNTCWSWSDISSSFLNSGAKGYIGTLWAVENKIAKEIAEKFYSIVFTKPIIYALYDASKIGCGTSSENIYVFWGLHLAKVTPGTSLDKSRSKVMGNIIAAHTQWRDNVKGVNNDFTKSEIHRLLRWHLKEIKSLFFKDWLKYTS